MYRKSGLARGCDSWCRSKGEQPLETRTKKFKFWPTNIRSVCLLSTKTYPMMKGDRFIVDKVPQPGLNVHKRGVSGYRRFHLGIWLLIIIAVCFHQHQTSGWPAPLYNLYFDLFLLICTSFVVSTRGIVCVVYLLLRLANYKDPCKRCVLAQNCPGYSVSLPVKFGW